MVVVLHHHFFLKHPYGIDLIIEDSVLHDGILEHTKTIWDYLLMKILMPDPWNMRAVIHWHPYLRTWSDLDEHLDTWFTIMLENMLTKMHVYIPTMDFALSPRNMILKCGIQFVGCSLKDARKIWYDASPKFYQKEWGDLVKTKISPGKPLKETAQNPNMFDGTERPKWNIFFSGHLVFRISIWWGFSRRCYTSKLNHEMKLMKLRNLRWRSYLKIINKMYLFQNFLRWLGPEDLNNPQN